MTDYRQYDAISEHYERVKHIPVGRAEQATVHAALPPLAGRSVLDVGCGTGFYCREFKRAGAAGVTGVDAAREMISYAQGLEEHDPLGISYEVHGAERLPHMGSFDVVTGIWLLGYAEDIEGLDGMLTRLVANLAPGGTLVALVPNPDLDLSDLDIFPRYGFTARPTEVVDGRQGYAIHVDGEPPIDIEGFSWPPGVLEPAFERAGLTDVRRHPAIAEDDDEFWAPLLANSIFAVFSGREGGNSTG
jgi:SAM-dependent methyltransferase